MHPRPANLVTGHETRVHRQPVEPHRAGAALTFAAPLLRARQAEPLAQHVEQAIGGIYLDGRGRAVEREGDPDCGLRIVDCWFVAHGLFESAFRNPKSAIAISFSGVRGIIVGSTPSASATALSTAGAGPSIGSSPSPFAPWAP